MKKIQGVKSLLGYLESVDYPLTEEQVNELLSKRKIPHSSLYGKVIMFELSHIDWWIAEQRKTNSSI